MTHLARPQQDIPDRTRPGADREAPPGTEKKRPLPDPRYVALRNFALSISVLNILGYTVLGFEQPWLWPLAAVAAAYATEILLEWLTAWSERRPTRFGGGFRALYEFLLPAHITALACNMLLYANDHILPMLCAVVIGVAQKTVLRAPVKGRMRHFMNPSNFGITVVLLAYSWIAIAPPYHFTEHLNAYGSWGLPAVILIAGTLLNAKLTRKLPLIAGWVGAFVLQAVARWVFLDSSLVSALSVMSGVAFILFTNYMITDPGTTPFRPRDQVVFGASVGVVYGLLILAHIPYTLFFAVSLVCAVRGAGWWAAHALTVLRRPALPSGAPAAGAGA
ncbi:enediyne biosynthesis protein [Streptomyces uncialis]|uniref:enediyne biosynthesis protein n=1 Tax=Streptomyces uncialis TaxID=1048205 RepID=UPI00225B9B29|nr:enediyne biosynthesis protein [Streptomyces uncialis]MCX4659571.1 enediyne biosynthesis protein [Streptomyces uncialis]